MGYLRPLVKCYFPIGRSHYPNGKNVLVEGISSRGLPLFVSIIAISGYLNLLHRSHIYVFCLFAVLAKSKAWLKQVFFKESGTGLVDHRTVIPVVNASVGVVCSDMVVEIIQRYTLLETATLDGQKKCQQY